MKSALGDGGNEDTMLSMMLNARPAESIYDAGGACSNNGARMISNDHD